MIVEYISNSKSLCKDKIVFYQKDYEAMGIVCRTNRRLFFCLVLDSSVEDNDDNAYTSCHRHARLQTNHY